MPKVTIDLITETKDATTYKLYVSARKYDSTDLEWLANKLNGYLDAIEFKSLEGLYPEVVNKNIIIQIDVIDDPPDNIVNLILNNHNQIIGDKTIPILLHKVGG